MAYLTKDAFAALTLLPAEYISALEGIVPGWVDGQLAYWSGWIDSRLRKRYAVPFSEPYPESVTGWLARIVTVRCWLKRGVDPTDEQFLEVKADHDRAIEEIKEAADALDGLFELPLRADTTASGVSKGGPFSYTEASPYVWTDVQVDAGRAEDSNRGGSLG